MNVLVNVLAEMLEIVSEKGTVKVLASVMQLSGLGLVIDLVEPGALSAQLSAVEPLVLVLAPTLGLLLVVVTVQELVLIQGLRLAGR